MSVNLDGLLISKFNGKSSFTTYGTIDMFLSNVPDVKDNFCGHVRSHMEYLERIKGFSNNDGHKLNTLNGLTFELIVMDALIKYGVPSYLIERNHRIAKSADVDIMLGNNGLHLKKSLRERWKEDDRTNGIAASLGLPISMYGLTYKEHLHYSDTRNIAIVDNTNRNCFFGLKWYSILSEETTNNFIAKLIHETKHTKLSNSFFSGVSDKKELSCGNIY